MISFLHGSSLIAHYQTTVTRDNEGLIYVHKILLFLKKHKYWSICYIVLWPAVLNMRADTNYLIITTQFSNIQSKR